MSRIRSIKPEFWSHQIMGRIDDTAKCIALALLNYADDKGYFYADPILVRNFCRPFDEDSTNVRRALETLQKAGWIQICDSPKNGEIGKVVNFLSHQKIDRASPSRIEKYFDSTRTRRGLDEDSLREGIMEGIMDHGREAPKPPRKNDPQTDPRDFRPPTEDEFNPDLPTLAVPALQTSIRLCFQSKNPVWPHMQRQVEAIKWLADSFTTQALTDGVEPEHMALTMIERFWTLKQSGDKFWGKQPFEPKMMESLWGQIKAETSRGSGTPDVSVFEFQADDGGSQ